MKNLLYQFVVGKHVDRHHQIWLTGVGATLLHLTFTWRLLHQMDQVVISALFWIAILRLFVDLQRGTTSDRFSRFIGRLLLGFIITSSLTVSEEAWFVRLFPSLTMLSLGLMISGFQLHRYWRVGLLFIPLMLPRGMAEQLMEQWIGIPVQVLTAQVAAFILHYLGFDAVPQNTVITLNQGAVDVLFRCTGIPLLILLLQLSSLFLIVFPISAQQQIRIVMVATAIAFLLSSLRVALMTIVVKDPIAFDYWHGGNGSQIFSTGAIVLFGWYCQQSLPRVQID